MPLFKKTRFLPLLGLFAVVNSLAQVQPPISLPVIMSSLKGKESKPRIIMLPAASRPYTSENFKVLGSDSGDFKVISFMQVEGQNSVKISFNPSADFTAIKRAKLNVLSSAGKLVRSFDLTGLSTNGLEGENEAPLSQVITALGYSTNPGWTTLANNSHPTLLGEEIASSLFKKAGTGNVEMEPVARYSPDFELPFGYYTNPNHAPEKHQAGVLAKSGNHIQHQTLYPDIASGSKSFDPGAREFGFFATSPTHTAYSEDFWNMAFFPDNAVHATRIYPAKSKDGKALKNTYLVCFEEALNGDYNDYVFLVKNVVPVTEEKFTAVFNGKDYTGWDSYLRGVGSNVDPDRIFKVENGAMFVSGKVPGYVITKKSFTDYHLKVDFKWGVTKWPPRQNAKRDGGICYNIAQSVPDSLWPASIECQIQEGDTGDFWMLGFSTLQVNGKVNRPTNHIQAVKKRDNEKPYGEWNTVEVISYRGRCIHIVNGVVVNYGDNASVKSGRFLLQSEFSEIYYKNVKIREL